MPRLAIETLKTKTAKGQVLERRFTNEKPPKRTSLPRSSTRSSQSTLPSIYTIVEPEPEPDPPELIYNIRYDALQQAPRSTVLKQNLSQTPLQNLPIRFPPLLVDGRLQIVEIPRWKRSVGFYWRSCSGDKTRVHWKTVSLPWKIWMERNFRVGKWTVLWVERS